MKALPLISVIIPTYNYAHYISKAIDSILIQDYPIKKIEIIVYDDGSNDNTKEIVGSYTDRCNIKYYFQSNSGKASATQKAINECNGKYIFNLDADDYYLSGKIKKSVEVFEADEGIVHVASAAGIVSNEGLLISEERIDARMLNNAVDGIWLLEYFLTENKLFGGGSTFAARATVLKKIVIDPAVNMYIDEFLLYAVLAYGKSFFLKETLSIWRVHGNNFSVSTPVKKNYTRIQQAIAASAIVLNYLSRKNYSGYILRLYSMKHENRVIASSELLGTKRLIDIYHYGKRILALHPPLKTLKLYKAYNRLIPLQILNKLKKLKLSKLRIL